jgi:hypothetical protein
MANLGLAGFRAKEKKENQSMRIYYAINEENKEGFFLNQHDAYSFDAYQEPLAIEVSNYLEAMRAIAKMLFVRGGVK